ncbi:bifunctional aminoglycoside phosphotransferase/ATP-binding protein [Roseixanthobacter pseudopolyaromaticivorans]|uniref:bifunctional aminoglycoside phosphotransferase/ATP-binding protein n=1 Tax=Xanthobacteraceae TaxID=335928 RepID=UPI00372624F3
MDSHVVADQNAVFAFLADPSTHGGAQVSRIDTHGAAVFLAGAVAYKVKRAVAFPYMDFSTLEKRHAACERELDVNRANAPGIYLAVVPIARTADGLSLGGTGTPVEYAVKMRRFDEAQTLDRLKKDAFTPALIAALAHAVSAAHARAPVIRNAADAIAPLASVIEQNAADFAENPEFFPPEAARTLTQATVDALESVAPLLRRRAAQGHVRRCHGDLHLRNIVLLDGTPVLFDAIEFNDDIAVCDVLYDLAFLLMDLWERGLSDAANGVLNRYLWAGPEEHYAALAALPLFLSLRAAIRAKVQAAGLAHLPAARQEEAGAEIAHYFAQARAFLGAPKARLLAVGGLSGTGKSTLAAALAPSLGRAPGAVILRSDIERKSMAGIGETEALPPEAYTPEATRAVYDRVRTRAALALTAGHTAIADAVHAQPQERRAIEAVAHEAGVDFLGLWLDAPVATLIERVEKRHGDASDATADVVRRQADYDLGEISWHRIAAAHGVRDEARAILKAAGFI